MILTISLVIITLNSLGTQKYQEAIITGKEQYGYIN